jgi:hypothetical protein
MNIHMQHSQTGTVQIQKQKSPVMMGERNDGFRDTSIKPNFLNCGLEGSNQSVEGGHLLPLTASMRHSGMVSVDGEMRRQAFRPEMQLNQRQKQQLQFQQMKILQEQHHNLHEQLPYQHHQEHNTPPLRTHSMQQQSSNRSNFNKNNMTNVVASRGSMNSISRSYSDSIALPDHRQSTRNSHNQTIPSVDPVLHPSTDRFEVNHTLFEPRPIDPFHEQYHQPVCITSEQQAPISPSYQETEPVGPLVPTRRRSITRDRRGLLDHENSCSSLKMDNIFVSERSIHCVKLPSDRSIGANNNYGNGNYKSSNKLSSSSHHNNNNMSVMMLSMGDMSHDNDGTQLGTKFNNSMRLSYHSKAPPKYPYKQQSIDGDGTTALTLSEHGTGSLHGIGGGSTLFGLDMSVASMSDFGDGGSVARMMTESQADMSFGNVFDETDREIFLRNNGSRS